MTDQITIHYLGQEYKVQPELGCYKVLDALDSALQDAGEEPLRQEPLYALGLQLHGFGEYGESVVPTVNLGEFIGVKNATYIDVNNYGDEMLQALEEANVLVRTGHLEQCGFALYPLCVFTDDFIQSYKNEAYEMYSDAYDSVMGENRAEDEVVFDSNDDAR